jgi:hypothetical protein
VGPPSNWQLKELFDGSYTGLKSCIIGRFFLVKTLFPYFRKSYFSVYPVFALWLVEERALFCDLFEKLVCYL